MRLLLVLALMIAAPGFGQTAESYRRKATEFAQKKDWDEAIANFHKALSLDPHDPLTHYDLALALKYKGVPKDAAEEFQQAIQEKPKWADAHYALGATWYDLHDLPAAANELQKAIQIDPANAASRRFLARVYSEQNDFFDAERELNQAVGLKHSPEMYFELGLVEGQLAKLEAAASAFRHALILNAQSEPAQLMLGVTLRRQGDHKEALEHFRRATEINPQDPDAQYNLGMELKTAHDLTAAIAAFQRAIELKPDFEQAHYNLGIALRDQGKTGAAQKEMTDLKGLHDFRIRLAQAKMLTLQGVEELKKQNLDAAQALFQKSIDQAPELPTGYYYLGLTWERKNDTAQALAAYQKALEIKPDYAQAHASLGLLYWGRGDRSRALDEFRQAV